MIIDTHCHYDMMPQPEAFIRQCEQVGDVVIGMTNLPSHFQVGQPHLEGFKHIRLALGLHPLRAHEGLRQIPLFYSLLNKTSYIGEIGLDFSREGYSTKSEQIIVLREVLSAIRGKNKIVSVHSRRAEKEIIGLLCEYEIKNVIFHWYSGPVNMIPAIIEQGYYLSVNEAMCLSKNGRAIISQIPRERVLTETDAPYNERCDILKVIAYLAEIWNMSSKEVEAIVERNFMELLKSLK